MEKRVFCLFLTTVMLLTGCSEKVETETVVDQTVETKEQVKEEVYTVEASVYADEISLELPISTVRALVDCNGYQADREKVVVFHGENLTEGFRVVREEDWEVVLEGTMHKAAPEEEARYVSIYTGDFSDLVEPGTYYIEQDQVGRSYTFAISENIYEPIFQGLVQDLVNELPQAENVGPADICDVSFGMHSMMLALQCHGVLFEKDNNLVMQLLETAEWLMSFQDEATGSMFEDYEATAAFCGILAQSADTFGKYDSDVSKKFVAASQKAWKWLEKQEAQAKDYPSAQYYAATQLFKREGSWTYKTIIEDYLESRKTKITEDRFSFYGSVIYLNTVKNTNRDLCTKIMQELVEETEAISTKAKENPYLVYCDDVATILQKVLLICFVDYITPSNEYAVIIENTLHYLLGRNETGTNYLDEAGVWYSCEATAQKTFEWNGILLLCLSDLLNVEADDVE